jgi:hypothetical protein
MGKISTEHGDILCQGLKKGKKKKKKKIQRLSQRQRHNKKEEKLGAEMNESYVD